MLGCEKLFNIAVNIVAKLIYNLDQATNKLLQVGRGRDVCGGGVWERVIEGVNRIRMHYRCVQHVIINTLLPIANVGQ